MSARGSYYAGGALPGAPVAWNVTTAETNFTPAGWDTFTFGIFRPWWWADSFESGPVGRSFPGPPTNTTTKSFTGTTDASGRHALQLDFTGAGGKLPDLPVSVNVAGTVTDVNRQAWSDQQDILVHSADRYVGLRSDRPFVRQGDPIRIETVVTDVDGKPQTGAKITVSAGLVASEFVNGEYVETVTNPQTCDVTSQDTPTECEFDTPVGGQYKITTTVAGSTGGRNRTELSVWVSGAAAQPARTVEQEVLTIIPDRQRYEVGQTAKLLLQAPFNTGEGLVLVTHRDGIRTTEQVSVVDGTAEVSVQITEADVPSISVTGEVVGASTRVGLDGVAVPGAPPRPAYAVGTLTLSVPPLTRTLTVQATPKQAELAPSGSTTVDVTVKDATGAPVTGAEFAAVVVDEAVLGLTNYTLPNPIDIFYGAGYSNVGTRFGREQVRLADPVVLGQGAGGGAPVEEPEMLDAVASAAETSAPALRKSAAPPSPSAGDAEETVDGPDPVVAVRSNFDALALFKPTVTTDASGRASVAVTLPDNLTRYRVMIVAVSGNDRFGTAESTITARLPLSIRPSAPRFLNTGDSFEFPVVVQNLDSSPMRVDVLLQVANLSADGPLAQQVTVPGNDRVEVRFPVSVKLAGTARYRASGFSSLANDSAEGSIPVFTPGTSEAFATYGTIDAGATRQPILSPVDVFDGYGGLEVTTSSTSLQALTDALLYVNDYDYQSSDAYASRIMAISALRKVLRDFETADLPSEAELNAAVERDIAGLVGLQNDDGGWSWWRRYDTSEPYNTVQALHALALARRAGFAVSDDTIERATQYVSEIEQFISPSYGDTYRDTIRAYAIWTLALIDQRDPAKANALYRERGEKLNLDALAWIWSSLDDPAARANIERIINNRAVDTAGAVSFTSGYTDSDYLTLGSDTRTDAIVLDALIANTPTSDLVEKTVAGLMARRTKGRWSNAQENSFVLLALKRYYDTYESATPNFVAKVWLGQQFAGEQRFSGRSTQRNRISVPMKELVAGGNRDLIVSKDGTGRLYYRIGMKYVPADLTLEPMDRGFVVQRTYEAVDDKSDVVRNADGSWRIKAGAKVRVKLTMVAESQRTFVALVDPLPAGFEALNPTLAVTQPVPPSPDDPSGIGGVAKFGWWWGNWYSHQQFRDDRSEAFTTYLEAGVYEYSYVARATTPGSFVVPPTRAEEMYAPETFGRAATDRVVIG
jgi:alpha-2-macroglobulin